MARAIRSFDAEGIGDVDGRLGMECRRSAKGTRTVHDDAIFA